MTNGQIAYEAYCNRTGWKSLATGADLPRWDKLNVDIREAWEAAADTVVQRALGQPQIVSLEPCEQLVFMAPITLRQHFAAAALQALSNGRLLFTLNDDGKARAAYELADAMIRVGSQPSSDLPNASA